MMWRPLPVVILVLWQIGAALVLTAPRPSFAAWAGASLMAGAAGFWAGAVWAEMRGITSCRIGPTHPYRGWYSASAAARYGSWVYRTVEGSEVEVTCVECPEHVSTGCGWPDRLDVGRVVAHVRKARYGMEERTERISPWEWTARR